MHDHDGHDHGHHHDHEHEHGHDAEAEPEVDLSSWAAGADKATCPACGASGALTLGGGVFCPTCGAVTTNAGYEPAPPPDAEPD